MVSKAVIFCATALLIQTTFGQCLRNIEVTTSDCGCSSSSNSRTRSSNGSGSVRAVGIGSFTGGKFVSGSTCSNTDSSSSSTSNSIVFDASLASSDFGFTSQDKARSSSNSILSIPNAGYIVTNGGDVSGGPFIVSSYGPVVPSGISVNAYNDLYGDLLVSGELPFLSAVAFDGVFQNVGDATVSYGCGDGNIAIQEIIGAKPGSCGYIL